MFKCYRDEVIIARAPDMSQRTFTPGKMAAQERFRMGAQYGKLALAEPATHEVYETAALTADLPLFSLAMSDFFSAPVFDAVNVKGYSDQADESTVVLAHDDFEVSSVVVHIKEVGGQVVESGAATQAPPRSGRWVYTIQQAVTNLTGASITATASDRPGNVGVKTATKASQ